MRIASLLICDGPRSHKMTATTFATSIAGSSRSVYPSPYNHRASLLLDQSGSIQNCATKASACSNLASFTVIFAARASVRSNLQSYVLRVDLRAVFITLLRIATKRFVFVLLHLKPTHPKVAFISRVVSFLRWYFLWKTCK